MVPVQPPTPLTVTQSEISCCTSTAHQIYLALLSNPASLWHVANLAPTLTMLTIYRGIFRQVLHNMPFTPSRRSRLLTTPLLMTSPPLLSLSRSPKSQAINVYAAEVVELQSYMRVTGKASSVPHGNPKWIFKPSAIKPLPIGRLVQTTASPTHDTINSCALMQQRVRSPVLKANATSRDLTAT